MTAQKQNQQNNDHINNIFHKSGAGQAQPRPLLILIPDRVPVGQLRSILHAEREAIVEEGRRRLGQRELAVDELVSGGDGDPGPLGRHLHLRLELHQRQLDGRLAADGREADLQRHRLVGHAQRVDGEAEQAVQLDAGHLPARLLVRVLHVGQFERVDGDGLAAVRGRDAALQDRLQEAQHRLQRTLQTVAHVVGRLVLVVVEAVIRNQVERVETVEAIGLG